MTPSHWIVVCGATMVLTAPVLVQEKGGEDIAGPYEVVANWPQPLPGHEAWVWGATTGIYAESPDRVFVIQRGELPKPEGVKPGWDAIAASPGRRAEGKNRFEHCVYIVNREGRIIDSWPQWDTMFQGGRGPHKISIDPNDPEKHVWIVDDMLNQVFKFTNDGKRLVLTLGERLKAGEDASHFNRPTDIAFLPDGTFFISDGYVNSRVVKFDRTGKFILAWGKRGTGTGEFNLPHGIAVGQDRRVYVADRSNSRIQIFREDGTYIDEWRQIRSPFDVHEAADGTIWVADGETNKMLQYGRDGKLLHSFGTYGLWPGYNWGIHQFSGDSEGNLYWAETYAGRAQKLTSRQGMPAERLFRPTQGSGGARTGR